MLDLHQIVAYIREPKPESSASTNARRPIDAGATQPAFVRPWLAIINK